MASFAIFAVGEAKSASGHQREALGPAPATAITSSAPVAAPAPQPATAPTQGAHQSGLHQAIDNAAGSLTSPFSGLVSGSADEWAIRAFKLLAALLVYGFGLGYLARTLRVSV